MPLPLVLALVLTSGCAVDDELPPPLPIPADDVRFGVFEGRVPCAPEACEKIKFRVMLSHDPVTRAPTAASVETIDVPAETTVRNVHQGTWRIERGSVPGFPDAAAYVIDGAPAGFTGYLAIGDDLLLMLDDARALRIGNASWSYTLSRTR